MVIMKYINEWSVQGGLLSLIVDIITIFYVIV